MGSTISIIIPHYIKNPCSDLLKCLDSLFRCSDKGCFEIIVVLNGGASYQECMQRIRRSYDSPALHLIDGLDVSTSYSARNLGIKFSTGEILAFIDSDVEVTSSFFSDLRRDFSDDSVMLSGGMVRFTGENKVSFITANLAVRRKVFEKILFKGNLYSGGDLDFSRRAIAQGMRAEYSYNRTVIHKHENYLMRIRKSLRYGSGTSFAKLCKSWVSLFKDSGMLFAKSIGFLYFCICNKPIGKK